MKVTQPLSTPPSTGITKEQGSPQQVGRGKVPQPLVQPSLKANVKGSDVWLITNLNFSSG